MLCYFFFRVLAKAQIYELWHWHWQWQSYSYSYSYCRPLLPLFPRLLALPPFIQLVIAAPSATTTAFAFWAHAWESDYFASVRIPLLNALFMAE